MPITLITKILDNSIVAYSFVESQGESRAHDPDHVRDFQRAAMYAAFLGGALPLRLRPHRG